MRRLRAATAALLVLVGCSQSPEKAEKEARQAAGSWGATLSAAAQRWGSREISTAFFQSVLTQARTSLKKEAQAARKAGGDAAATPVDAVSSHVDAIDEAAARGDRAAAIHEADAAAAAVPAAKTAAVARSE